MTAPIPKTITNEVWVQLAQLLLTAERWYPSDDADLLALERKVDNAVNRHPEEAQMCWGMLRHLQGDFDETVRFYEQARKYGFPGVQVDSSTLTVSANLLFASVGLRVARGVVNVANLNITAKLPEVVSIGGIRFARELFAQAERAAISLDRVAQIRAIREIVSGVPDDISDEVLARAIDCAGVVLRSRKLFWLDREPRLVFDHGTRCMGIRYRVKVPPTDAAAMNLELTDLLIERDLHLAPITLGFVGVAAE